MLIPDHGMNSSPGVLYRSSDSGAHWLQVNSTEGSQKRHGYLICGGEIAFRDDSTGWVRGSLTTTDPSLLFATRDGGRNWQVQRLSLPASFEQGRMEPNGLPRFFQRDSNEGILPAEYYPTDGYSTNFSTVIYRTRDGGLSWQPTTPVKFSGICSFISVRKGWMWSPEPHNTGSSAPVKGTLYRTDDGGISWRPAGTGKSLEQDLTHGEDVAQLDFVDGEYGWAIAPHAPNLTKLLHTTDGGDTWSAIPTKVGP